VTIRVVHLYPRELGINGDVGNVLALRKRAQWRGMPLEVHDHHPGQTLPESVHLVHIGSGPVSGQEAVRDDVARIAPTLRAWAEAGVPFLAIAGGWQLLGRELVGLDGAALPGAGVFPTRATITAVRRVGEVLAETQWGAIGGFENHGAVTELLDGAAPFARVIAREGQGTAEEGVVVGASIGTNLHGPLLPMNPAIADHLLAASAQLAGIPMGQDDDRIRTVDDRAARSRAAIRARLR
jgi:CobQ-like glutamine amidotransferase family enzyme